jgi:hypothetical protein
MTALEVQNLLLPLAENDEMKTYIRIHAKRYAYLISKLKSLRREFAQDSINIMDIGPSFFTKLLMITFPNDTIHCMGFKNDEALGGHLSKQISLSLQNFTQFDLNDAQYIDKYPADLPPCDLVVMAEVLEHLYTSPVLIYQFISTFLNKNGFLVIGTPNAVTFRNRVLMLVGRNPFEQIRETRDNPGHFREYTGSELMSIGERVHFETYRIFKDNYFSASSAQGKLFDFFTGHLLPKSFRTGLTIVYKKK